MLLVAKEAGVLKFGNISLDVSKIYADVSKSKAVSHKRLLAIEAYLQAEVNELFTVAEAADGGQGGTRAGKDLRTPPAACGSGTIRSAPSSAVSRSKRYLRERCHGVPTGWDIFGDRTP